MKNRSSVGNALKRTVRDLRGSVGVDVGGGTIAGVGVTLIQARVYDVGLALVGAGVLLIVTRRIFDSETLDTGDEGTEETDT